MSAPPPVVALAPFCLHSRRPPNLEVAAMAMRTFTLLSACLVALSVLALAPRQTAAAERSVGELVEAVGSVAVLRNGGSGRLSAGDPIREDDLIVTGAEARARIRFDDGTMLAIGSGSQLAVLEYLREDAETGRRGVLSLLIGIVRAVVAPNPDRPGLDIETRVAVASVRSTDLMVESAIKGAAVVTLEGEVAVASRPPGPVETVVLTEGMGTDVPPDGPPSPPARWGDARVAAFLDRTRVP